ncbi:MAG: hypothetical protein GC138_04980 [Gammaproteobacteria bacterium]|nr:hypothetical protein [Gammaproteobacteria bacterium]
MIHAHRFDRMPAPPKSERGYILLLVAIFILVLMSTSAQFFNRVTENTRMSGGMRDNNEAVLLAESALNHLMGQFVNSLDANANGTADKTDAGAIQVNMTDPSGVLMPYMFYVSTGTALDQTTPSLLQKVADGEASNAAAAAYAVPRVSSGTATVRVNSLFISAAMKPMLYTVNNNGLLIDSAAANWNGEANSSKAAAWIEVAQTPNQADAVDLYVQAVAEVGNAHTYLQRYIGTYFSSVTIGSISVLAEASNILR